MTVLIDDQAALRTKARELRKVGKSVKAISDELGVSRKLVGCWTNWLVTAEQEASDRAVIVARLKAEPNITFDRLRAEIDLPGSFIRKIMRLTLPNTISERYPVDTNTDDREAYYSTLGLANVFCVTQNNVTHQLRAIAKTGHAVGVITVIQRGRSVPFYKLDDMRKAGRYYERRYQRMQIKQEFPNGITTKRPKDLYEAAWQVFCTMIIFYIKNSVWPTPEETQQLLWKFPMAPDAARDAVYRLEKRGYIAERYRMDRNGIVQRSFWINPRRCPQELMFTTKMVGGRQYKDIPRDFIPDDATTALVFARNSFDPLFDTSSERSVVYAQSDYVSQMPRP